MRLLTEPQIDGIVDHRRRLMIVGLTVMILAIAVPRGWGIGLFSGFMLFSLGIYGIAFRRWRTERGVWMLAVFLTVTLAPCWAYFEALNLRGLFDRPAAVAMNWDKLRLSIDCIVALMLFARAISLAITVAIENWKRTQLINHKDDSPRQLDA
jgi:hypothetical protein